MNSVKIVKMVTVLLVSAGLMLGASSCAVFVKGDNGQHKGWYKNSNNPHHPNSTNPGKSEGKHNK